MAKEYFNAQDPAYLIISREGQKPRTFQLEKGSSVFIGSGSNCRLILERSAASPIHCMVWLDDQKRLKVQDWNTGKTILNGKPIDSESVFLTGDVLTVAEYQIIPVLTPEFHLGIASEILSGDAKPTAASHQGSFRTDRADDDAQTTGIASFDFEESDLESEIEDIVSGFGSLAEFAKADAFDSGQDIDSEAISLGTDIVGAQGSVGGRVDDDLPWSPQFVESESVASTEASHSIKKGGFQYDVDADLKSDDSASDDLSHDTDPSGLGGDFNFDISMDFADDDIDDDHAAMLQLEVDQLRFELADRDSQIAALKEAQNGAPKHESGDDEETLKLVGRLEELLGELQSSDGRVRNLEELLRLSDEATHAEKEEREQLQIWVGEIENRVDQRDAERQAEIDRLESRLEQSKEQLGNAEKQFKKLLASQQSSGSVATISDESKKLISECRNQITSLQQQLEAANESNAKLRAELESSGGANSQELKSLQDKLVAMQVETSRERAETARRHAELERIRDELEERLNNVKVIGKSDSRIKAMREHLREIHEQEKVEKEEVRKNSLSGRIAGLLSRLR